MVSGGNAAPFMERRWLVREAWRKNGVVYGYYFKTERGTESAEMAGRGGRETD